MIGALFRVRVRETEVETVEVEVFEDGAGAVEGVELGHDPHIPSRQRWRSDDVDAGDTDGARRGQNASGADADGSRLAGAIGAEQAVQLALADAERDAVHGDDALLAFVDLAKSLYLDDYGQTSLR